MDRVLRFSEGTLEEGVGQRGFSPGALEAHREFGLDFDFCYGYLFFISLGLRFARDHLRLREELHHF